MSSISIHAPAGGATIPLANACCLKYISIHAPAGGATLFCHFRLSCYEFQSTRLREARRGDSQERLFKRTFQSTRLREARLVMGLFSSRRI